MSKEDVGASYSGRDDTCQIRPLGGMQGAGEAPGGRAADRQQLQSIQGRFQAPSHGPLGGLRVGPGAQQRDTGFG